MKVATPELDNPQADRIAELSIIHRGLMAPDVIPELATQVPPSDLFYAGPKKAWSLLLDMHQARRPITAASLEKELEKSGVAKQQAQRLIGYEVFGGEASISSPSATSEAIRRIKQCAHARERARLISKLSEAVQGNGAFKSTLDDLVMLEERDPLAPTPWLDRPPQSTAIRSDEFLKQDIPEPEEYVEPALVMKEGVTMIAGPSKLGKSMVVLNMAKLLTDGKPFLRQHPVKKANVFYLQTEMGVAAIKKRTEKLELASDRFWIRNVNPGEFALNTSKKGQYGRKEDTGHRDAVVSLVRDLQQKKIDVLIIDPIYELLDGSEIDEFAMKSLFASLKAIARYTPCAVVAVHHTKKRREGDWEGPELASGHNVLTRAPDALLTIIQQRRSDDTYRFRLKYTLRHAAEPEDAELIRDGGNESLRWRAMPWSDEGSLDVLMALESNPNGLKAKDIAQKADIPERTVYRKLNALNRQGKVQQIGRGLWVIDGGRS